jgi:pimeloyl-ACP methyl ester carboxylesterase
MSRTFSTISPLAMPPENPLISALKEVLFTVSNGSGDVIRGDLRYTERGQNLPAVIVCHGFTAHKDWGPFPFIGRRLAEYGFASLVFNFSHNGIGKDFRKFSEFEKFSRNTVGKEIEDVEAIVQALSDGEIAGGIVDRSWLAVMGHSRGGGIAILSARRDQRLKAVAAWSTVATFHRYSEHQKHVWERDGYLPVTIRGTRTRLRYGIEVLRDLEANMASYDLHAAVRSLKVPLLLVHGTEDLAVRPAESKGLYGDADPRIARLIMIEGAGHMFGASHPFRGRYQVLEQVIHITEQWFHSHFSGGSR